MVDHAISAHAGVQQQLDRLTALSPGRDVLGLERIRILCERLGNPQNKLPRLFHVAGTNGKGSTCANLRAMLEAKGRRVHSYNSPHLVRFNERIRLAGTLISDDYLAELLAEVLDVAEDLQASFFEVTTAAAFLAFSRTPADDVILEVGLGGRLDATNIVPAPAVCGIASLAIDHEGFLLAPEDGVPAEPLPRIAFEKSGIIKAGCQVATLAYAPDMRDVIVAKVAQERASLFAQDQHWRIEMLGAESFLWHVGDESFGPFTPALQGPHQVQNAGLALAMLYAANPAEFDAGSAAKGLASTIWPGRIQRLDAGPLTTTLSERRQIWIDGGHNFDAAQQLACYLGSHLAKDRKVDLIVGMLSNKAVDAFISTVAPYVGRMIAVPISGHEHHSPDTLIVLANAAGISQATAADDLPSAVQALAEGDGHILIGGSLYLVGKALEINQQFPE
jgi:dihydrofolate synthase/folylpolyglutamate synthase